MTKIDFHHNDRPTVGIELELGLGDGETMALASAYGLINARLTAEGHQDADATRYKPELMQCVLEINTDVCETIGEADRDLSEQPRIAPVGADAAEKAVLICDGTPRHLPAIVAPPVSSPSGEGRNTGLHSHRSKIME